MTVTHSKSYMKTNIFLCIILHNPQLVKTLGYCKKSNFPWNSLGMGSTVCALLKVILVTCTWFCTTFSISENFTAFFGHLIEKVKLNECVQMCGSMSGDGNTPSEWKFCIIFFSCTKKLSLRWEEADLFSWIFLCLSSSFWLHSVLIHIFSCLPWFIIIFHIIYQGRTHLGLAEKFWCHTNHFTFINMINLCLGLWRTESNQRRFCRAPSSAYLGWFRIFKRNAESGNQKFLWWLANESVSR